MSQYDCDGLQSLWFVRFVCQASWREFSFPSIPPKMIRRPNKLFRCNYTDLHHRAIRLSDVQETRPMSLETVLAKVIYGAARLHQDLETSITNYLELS